MKKGIIFIMLLFLLIGVVSASENINITDENNTLSVEETHQDPISVEDSSNDTLTQKEDVKLQQDGNSTPETPTITTSSVSGTAGKTIILKAVVKNSTGAIKGLQVTFKLNGKTYKATTDANGIAKVSVKCPSSAAYKTTSKTRGKILTKTTKYCKTYSATASASGASSSFKVTSKKASLVKKYKIIKKTKITTIPIKNGKKIYKRGNYAFGTVKKAFKNLNFLGVIGADKNGYIKFFVKDHVKKNGKWSWDSWYKVKKGLFYQYSYPKTMKVDKVKIKYTQVTQKRIK